MPNLKNTENISEKEKDLLRNINTFNGMIENIGPVLAMNFLINYAELNKFSIPKKIIEKPEIRNTLESSLEKLNKKELELDISNLKNTYLRQNFPQKNIEELVSQLSLKWEINEEIFWRVKNVAETENDNAQLEKATEARTKKLARKIVAKLMIKPTKK